MRKFSKIPVKAIMGTNSNCESGDEKERYGPKI
jgi:hypothetical protein